MQKLCSKLGLVVVLSCLTLAIGLVASNGSAFARESGHRPVSRVTPRISMKLLSGRYKFHGHYVQRILLSGFGFDGCNDCAGASTYDGCSCYSGCDSNCGTSCAYYVASACGNDCQTCSATSGSSCAAYSACGADSGIGYSSCPSNCGSTSGPVVIGSGHPSCTSNCGGTNGSVVIGSTSGHPACTSNCGGATGSTVIGSTTDGGHPACTSNCGSTTGPVVVGNNNGSQSACTSNCGGATGFGVVGNGACTSYNACASTCDCANVQSSLPIYGQDVNLSQVPLNAFGEFRVVVLVQVPTHPSTASYRMWAINRYNNDCSNILSGSQSW